MLKSKSKSQSALEFLTTYAWAFVVIMITIGALYYFGVLDFRKYTPQKCIFPSQMKCLDFSLQIAEAKVKLLNDLGEKIEVSSVSMSNDVGSIACTPTLSNLPFEWEYATEKDITFSCSLGGYISGERVELIMTLRYFAVDTPTKPEHEVKGKINGIVT